MVCMVIPLLSLSLELKNSMPFCGVTGHPSHFDSYFCGEKEQTKGEEGAARIPMGTNCFREKDYVSPKVLPS